MSDDPRILEAGQALAQQDFEQAMNAFEAIIADSPDLAEAHFGWAEAAFMRITLDMEEGIPAIRVKKAYEKAIELDEENLEYQAGLGAFLLDAGRIPLAVKTYQAMQQRAEVDEMDISDVLYEAAGQLIQAIERQDRENPAAAPFLSVALEWAVKGLGFDVEDAISRLQSVE